MVQVSYPGVYVVEVPSGVHTITGVATSIAAFFGRTANGPMNKAVHVLSPSDFTRAFTKGHPSSDLAQSVTQFFNNGGTECYVVRLAKNARKSAITLKTLGSTNVLVFTAKSEGVWGDGVKLLVDYNTPNPDDTFNVTVTYEDGGAVVTAEKFSSVSMNPVSPRYAPTYISQSSTLVDVSAETSVLGDPLNSGSGYNNIANTPAGYSEPRLVFRTDTPAHLAADLAAAIATNKSLTMIVNGQQPVLVDVTGYDPTAGPPAANSDVENSLTGFINGKLGAAIAGLQVLCKFEVIGLPADNLGVLRITSNTAPFTSVTIQRASSDDVTAALLAGLDQGGIEVARYSNLRPVPNGTVLLGGTALDAFVTAIDALAGVDPSVITALAIGPGEPLTLAVNPGPGGGAKFYVSTGSNDDGVREKLQFIAGKANGDPTLGWTAEVWGYHLALRKTSAGSINDHANASFTGAPASLTNAFIGNTRQYTLGTMGTSTFATAGVGGLDGDAPGVAEYLGVEADQTGFHALDSVDIFNLMVLPGDRDVTESDRLKLWGPASIYCQQQSAFLLMDPPDAWTSPADRPVAQATDVNTFRAQVVKDYSAVFYPRLQYSDGGVLKYIGPSGLIAGVMARIDSTRGVWKAPAGIEADLRGITDLEVNLTDKENGVLNKLGVNCMRKFPSGFVSWGARTMAGFDDNSNTDWKYIPIRRLALFLEVSLYRGTQWVVFEPNDEPLWAKIRLNLNAFMMGLFRQGAFQGSTPDKAFYVKCDSETTTQNDRNLGIVNIQVGFAPLKPAEFVVIYIQQIAGDL